MRCVKAGCEVEAMPGRAACRTHGGTQPPGPYRPRSWLPDYDRIKPPVPIGKVMAALPRACGECGDALVGHELAKLPPAEGAPSLCDECDPRTSNVPVR